ncbi:MAG: hypothetical protein JNK49_21905 [Planctomycetes bacterium]|nr:hypothetical protein [Planctomycetota bacterium]
MRTVAIAAFVALACWLGRAQWPGEIDAGNLGLALGGFAPMAHHPQPPGYLFHVALGKVFAALAGDAHRGLVLQAAITAGLGMLALTALLRRCLGAGLAPWLALAVGCTPVVQYMGGEALTGIDALALGALATLLLVRAAAGERRAFAAASLLLGLAGGFRPDVTAHLAVAWLVAARPWSWPERAGGAALLLVGALAWVLPTAHACGGLAPFLHACGYVQPILSREALWQGGDVERQAATLWRIGWGVLLGGGPALALGLCLWPWRRAAVAQALPAPTRSVLHAAAWVPLLLLAATFCHKKAYVFAALPALAVLAGATWQALLGARATAVLHTASAAAGLSAWLLLPAATSQQADAEGYGRAPESLPWPARLSWQPLEYTFASRRAMDARYDELARHILGAHERGQRVVVVSHPPDPIDLRPLGLMVPALTVVDLDGAPGAWRRIRVGQGASERRAEADADGRFLIDADCVIACVGWDRLWAEQLRGAGVQIVKAAPTVVFALAAGPVRW